MNGQTLYDELVKPQSTILDYHSEFSGITPQMMKGVTRVLADAQKDLRTLIYSDTILVCCLIYIDDGIILFVDCVVYLPGRAFTCE